MYIDSPGLLQSIASIANEAARRTNNLVTFREYIALPHYGGNIMLRFDLNADKCSIDELHRYEALLYSIAGDDFLIDFMGDVYQKIGMNPEALGMKLHELFVRYQDEPITDSVHKEAVLEDARSLQKIAGVSRFARVWEIQPGNPTLMLILGNQNALFRKTSLPDGTPLVVAEVREEECEGLMKAAFYAKRNHVSLGSLLL